MDLNLTTKQAFREAPRAITAPLGTVATPAGLAVYKIGSKSSPPLIVQMGPTPASAAR